MSIQHKQPSAMPAQLRAAMQARGTLDGVPVGRTPSNIPGVAQQAVVLPKPLPFFINRALGGPGLPAVVAVWTTDGRFRMGLMGATR